jgi:RNase H-fold protein (predicted Holliday junction resolvase)
MADSGDLPEAVLAVDPGRDKCGLALVAADGSCLRRAVVASQEMLDTAKQWAAEHGVSVAAVGDRTGGEQAANGLRELEVFESVVGVDEHRSSEEARRLYFREQPPRGLRRLIPIGLLTPSEPIDDYAAWVLALRFFARRRAHEADTDSEQGNV